MSAPGSHIAGKLVKKALSLKHHRYQSGPWAVISVGRNLGGTYDRIYAEMKLLHYDTVMLEWRYTPSVNLVELIGVHPGLGSVSDQTGVNSALRALGIQKYYSRVGVKHEGPSAVRINR